MHSIIIKSLIISLVMILFTACNEKNESQKESIAKSNDIQKKIKELELKELTTKALEDKKQDIKTANMDTQEVASYPLQELNKTSSIATKKTINNFDFDIIKKGYKDDNTLLIVGGIQGDEPGGFMAASLISTHYKITKGSVWVVPNLNFYSIIKRSRGPYGDMNRKFANLSKNDPEYETIQRIKSYIGDKSVKLIVNLHDGSGFYRPTYEDKTHSPYKWGQCSIIDQEKLKNKHYSNLAEIANQVNAHVNKSLLKKEHIYHLHNTRTVEGDKEMEKTLTYYAINQGKSAFGNEASKSLPTHQRVYYHLLALEKYMDIMGIEFERKFKLNDYAVKNILDNDIEISLYNDKIKLPLSKIRNVLKYFPITKDGKIDFIPSNPLMSIVKVKDEYVIYYGNRRVSILRADYIDMENNKRLVKLNIDSKDANIQFGTTVKVDNDFKIYPIKDYRVNVIGYTNKNKNETNISIKHNKMQKKFSIDKFGKTYRVEFYTKDKFAGMILVNFTG
ncbi:MAG: M99 family carboxypeptidase catalytic domain-containing protein [Campylobacterota bacterium]|nr:M99 family carboxypeptidase catalytic domain-containing protein [Campylobacterota bacterium]